MFAALAGFLKEAASAYSAISSSASNAVGGVVSELGSSVGEGIGKTMNSIPKTSVGASINDAVKLKSPIKIPISSKKSKYIAPEVQPDSEAGVPYIEAEEHMADLMNKTVQQ
jgi:hypothetical protein